MKKKCLCLIACLLTVTFMFAQTGGGNNNTPIPFKVVKTSSQQNQPSKSSVQIPEVYLDGHTLSFDAAIEGCEVRLLDENEDVVFSDFIEGNQTSLLLPSTLAGTFELQIVQGNIIFYCEIEL